MEALDITLILINTQKVFSTYLQIPEYLPACSFQDVSEAWAVYNSRTIYCPSNPGLLQDEMTGITIYY